METALEILLAILSLSLLGCFVRLYRGPDVPDRTVAFDLIASHSVGLFVLLGMRTNSPELITGATITLVLGFLGTVMLARFLESPYNRD